MKKQSALVLALCLFALVLAMCLYSAPRLTQEATAYAQAAPVVVIDAGHGGETAARVRRTECSRVD